MAAKSRTTLVNDSDAIFLDNTSGQIIPANHREFNDDVIESTANLLDENVYDGIQRFNNVLVSEVAPNSDALFSNDGNITLVGGGINCGGNSNFTNAFIATLQHGFGNQVYSASTGTIDTTNRDGNIIYIEDDGMISNWIGLQGRIYHAIFTGNAWVDVTNGNVEPPTPIHLFPSDTLTFVFITNNTIRVIGVYRSTNIVNGLYNGQNYFQINLAQDALDLQTTAQLALGAVYKVPNSYNHPTHPAINFDVYLFSESNDLFSTRAVLHDANTGAFHDALFTGSFNPGDIIITNLTDTRTPITFNDANQNGIGVGNSFYQFGSKAFIVDNNKQYGGYAYFDQFNLLPQRRNLHDLNDYTKTPFGCLKFVQSENDDRFIPNDGNTADIFWGEAWYDGAPSTTDITDENIVLGLTTQVNIYQCYYNVVNNLCSVYFNLNVVGKHQDGPSGHELQTLFPIPFTNNDENGFGFGTCRNNDSDNHEDIGVIVRADSGNPKYALITAKFRSATGTPENYDLRGCFTYIIDSI